MFVIYVTRRHFGVLLRAEILVFIIHVTRIDVGVWLRVENLGCLL